MTDLDPHLLRQIYATDCKQSAGAAVLYDQLWTAFLRVFQPDCQEWHAGSLV